MIMFLPEGEAGPGSGRLWLLSVCASVRTSESVTHWKPAPLSTHQRGSSSNVGADPAELHSDFRIEQLIHSQPVPFAVC